MALSPSSNRVPMEIVKRGANEHASARSGHVIEFASSDLGTALLALARAAIARNLGLEVAVTTAHEALADPGATFVTLTSNGELRGCMGSLEARRSLRSDVEENAVAAAFHDPRFRALELEEFDATRVEVSLLSKPQTLAFADEEDALARLRPGIDGIILSHHRRHATFLPQVWDSLPRPRDFLAQLKIKAGLPADYWSGAVTLARYEVRKWKEE